MASAQSSSKAKPPAKSITNIVFSHSGSPHLSRVQCVYGGEFSWYVTSDTDSAPLTFSEMRQSDNTNIGSGSFPQGYVLDRRTEQKAAMDSHACGAWQRGLDKDGEPSSTSYRLVFVSRTDQQATLCLQSMSIKGKVKKYLQ